MFCFLGTRQFFSTSLIHLVPQRITEFMNEHSFVRSIHNALHPDVYKWKIHDTYTGGVPDALAKAAAEARAKNAAKQKAAADARKRQAQERRSR